ncbi:MAG: hypothetical protein AB2598_02145 [Candidatus Thiodiazotropha sp.]
MKSRAYRALPDAGEVYTHQLDKSKLAYKTDQADQYFNSAISGAASRTIFL